MGDGDKTIEVIQLALNGGVFEVLLLTLRGFRICRRRQTFVPARWVLIPA
jgi:hypothetical protein